MGYIERVLGDLKMTFAKHEENTFIERDYFTVIFVCLQKLTVIRI